MALIEIKTNPSMTELRWFGLLLALFVILIGTVFRWRAGDPSVAHTIWVGGSVLVGIYIAAPPFRRWIFLGWIYATFPIGWIVSHVIIAVVYYFVICPISFLLRFSKRELLQRSFDCAVTSYWIRRPQPKDIRRYFKQF